MKRRIICLVMSLIIGGLITAGTAFGYSEPEITSAGIEGIAPAGKAKAIDRNRSLVEGIALTEKVLEVGSEPNIEREQPKKAGNLNKSRMALDEKALKVTAIEDVYGDQLKEEVIDEDLKEEEALEEPLVEEVIDEEEPIEEELAEELVEPFSLTEPVEVWSVEDFNKIRDNLEGEYILKGDIDLGGENFTPIGTEAAPFRGTLDGNGFKIENLSINVTTNNTGLFGYTIDSHIKDVVIEKANVKGSQYTGILAGRNLGHIENTKVSGDVEGTSNYIGGLVGHNTGYIEKSSAGGTVKGINYTGGLTGFNGGEIERSYSISNVNGNYYVGGLVGHIKDGHVRESYASGNVVGRDCGGFAGYIDGSSEISDSYSMGNVTGSYPGSFVYHISGNSKIKNSFALGSASYGFAITSNVENFVENSYFNGQASSKWTPALMAKTASDLKKKETFTDWDFETIWVIEEGRTFPRLRNVAGYVSDSEVVEISTVEEFNNIRNNLNGNYKLTADIDLSFEEFIPIGTETAPFRGILNGNGFKIENLKIEVTTNNTGLFGYISDGHVKDVVVEKADVKGSQYTGILAGRNLGHIENTKVSGNVEGTNNYAGGLVGHNTGSIEKSSAGGTVKGINYTGGLTGFNGGEIERSYSISNVNGNYYVGGLVGHIKDGHVRESYASGNVVGRDCGGFAGYIDGSSEISDSYSMGNVTGSYPGSFVYHISGNSKIKNSYALGSASYGFAVTSNVENFVENSYFNGQASSKWTPALMAKTASELKKKETFTDWDFETIWIIEEGRSFPRLRNVAGYVSDSEVVEISTVEEFNNIRNNLNGNYKLTADIDLSFEEFIPIGTETAPFRGILNGNGFKIENLKIEVTTNNTGLFGYISDGHVKDVVVEKADVKGSQYTGILAGRNLGHIENTKVSGNVEGTNNYAGGLVGHNTGSIEKSSAGGTVKGINYTGGLTGFNGGEIERSYSISNVNGNYYVGGLVGHIKDGHVRESYASGNVVGRDCGGFAGYIDGSSEISDSYSMGNVTGSYPGSFVYHISGNSKIKNSFALGSASYGFAITSNVENFVENSYFNGQASSKWTPALMAKTASDLKKKETFTDWDFETIWVIEEGRTFPRLRNVAGYVSDSEVVEISTVEEFNNIRNNLNGNYKLTADIDLSFEEFIPIGTETAPFRGILNGNGFKIENLKIEVTTNNTGLFGYISDGHVKDVVVEKADVKGSQYTGILAGRNLGHIENTKVSGNVEGTNNYAGGLVGHNTGSIEKSSAGGTVKGINYTGGLTGFNGGEIERSYSISNVNGNYYVGGLVGHIKDGHVRESYASGNVVGRDCGGFAGYIDGSSEISDSYSMGNVTGSYPGSFVYHISGNSKIKNSYALGSASYGFAVTSNVENFVENSYFNGQASSKWTPALMAKTASELKKKETFTDWDFETIWIIEEGRSFPRLRNVAGYVSDSEVIEISTVEEFNNIRNNLNGNYKLTADIDLSFEEFIPIGTETAPFRGILNGNGFKIENLKIEVTTNNTGLFGYISDGHVKDVVVEKADVKGSQYTGILAGRNLGHIENTKVSGNVEGTNNYTGGLVGHNTGSIEKSSAGGTVKGINYTGGLTGFNGGEIERSYSISNVNGNYYVGGLVGHIKDGHVRESYASGNVVGRDCGGFAGYIDGSSEISDSYSMGNVTGSYPGSFVYSISSTSKIKNSFALGSASTGFSATSNIEYFVENAYFNGEASNKWTPALMAKTTAELKDPLTFIGWDFESIWLIKEGEYPKLRMEDEDPKDPEEPEEPEIPLGDLKLQAEALNLKIKLSWDDSLESNLLGYNLFRVENEKEVLLTTVKKDGAKEYLDDNLKGDISYKYILEAVYKGGAKKRDNVSKTPINVDDVKPTANSGEDFVVYLGEETFFDGSLSKDNVGVVKYSWDIEGTFKEGNKVSHTFEVLGSHAVTLTVFDGAGNQATDQLKVEVIEKSTMEALTIRVLDEASNSRLSLSTVYVIKDGQEGKNFMANSNGELVIHDGAGLYDVSAYKNGYMPNAANVLHNGTEGKTFDLKLKKEELIKTEIEATRLTIDQIIEKGIDIEDTDNQFVYEFEVVGIFEGKKSKEELEGLGLSSSEDDIWEFTVLPGDDGLRFSGDGSGKEGAWVRNDSGYTHYGNEETIHINVISSRPEYPPTIAIIRIPTKVTFLKDFFELSVNIHNLAPVQFEIKDSEAKLNIPEGLSIISGSETFSMGVIEGGSQGKAMWLVRGDKEGSYDISADFSGILMPFEAVLEKNLKGSEPVKVVGGEGLKVHVQMQDRGMKDTNYFAVFTFENNSDVSRYNVGIEIGDKKNRNPNREITVFDNVTGKEQTLSGAEPVVHRIERTSDVNTIPYIQDGDSIHIKELKAGERYTAVYVTDFTGEIDDLVYYLRDLFYTEKESNNVKIEVELSIMPFDSLCAMIEGMSKCGLNGVDLTGYLRTQLDEVDMVGTDLGFNIKQNSAYNSLEAFEDENSNMLNSLGKGGWFSNIDINVSENAEGTLGLYYTRDDFVKFMHEDIKNGKVYGKVLEDGSIEHGIGPKGGTYISFAPGYNKHRLKKNPDNTYELRDAGPNTYYFNNEGYLIRVKDVNDRNMHIERTNLATIITKEGENESLSVTYDSKGRVIKLKSSNGEEANLVYDEDGNLIEIEDYLKEKSKYEYDLNNRLSKVIRNSNSLIYEYDENSRVIKETDELGNSTVIEYIEDEFISQKEIRTTDRNGKNRVIFSDIAGRVLKEVDELGYETEYFYDENGNMTKVEDGEGNKVSFEYNDKNLITKRTDLSGLITDYSYDSKGMIEKERFSTGGYFEYSYDDNKQLVSSTDERGMESKLSYDERGNVIKESTVGLVDREYKYGTDGNLSTVTDELGIKTNYTYDSKNNLIKTEDDKGRSINYTYDERYQLAKVESYNGSCISYTYDEGGNILSETDSHGNITSYEYDILNRLVKKTDAIGGYTSYSYDNESNLLMYVSSDEKSSKYSYNDRYQLASVTDEKGNTEAYTYDAAGNMISTVLPNGQKVERSYNESGLLKGETSVQTGMTSYSYDKSGRLLKRTDALGNSVSYTYDISGNVLETKGKSGEVFKSNYDKYGRLTSDIDALGNESKYEYRNDSRLLKYIDALGNATSYEWDEFGRLVKIIDAKGNESESSFDHNGRLGKSKDALGNETSYEYDIEGKLIKTVDAKGNETSYLYDKLGRSIETKNALSYVDKQEYKGSTYNVIKKVNAKGDIRAYSYDGQGNLIKNTDYEGNSIAFTYNNQGEMTSFMDQKDGVTSYEYDGAGRVIAETSPYGSVLSYAYDALSRTSEFTNARGSKIKSGYDNSGRLISRGDASFTYDENGNQITGTNLEGGLKRTYDGLNRVVSVEDIKGRKISYAYDELGNIVEIVYPEGEKVSYEYDALGRMTKVIDYKGRETSYTYDELGNLVKEIKADGTVETLSTDSIGRIVEKSIKYKAGEKLYSYVYDELDNILSEDINSQGEGLSVNVDKELTSLEASYSTGNRIDVYNGEAIEYDLDGNMIKGPLKGKMENYTYNQFNQLSSVGDTSYFYDASGARIKHENTSHGSEYVNDHVDGLSRLLLKKDFDGRETIYVYGNGLISEETKVGSVYSDYRVHHYDLRGSTVALTDEGGNVTSSYVYSPYGELLTSSGNDDSIFLYGGKYGIQTDDNGLLYMRARYYSTDTKSFINLDPIKDGSNWYSYVEGNPISYIDPGGLFKNTVIISGNYVMGGQTRNGTLSRGNPEGLRSYSRALLGSLPVIGDYYDAKDAITGREAFTGKKLTTDERMFSAACAAIPFVSKGPTKLLEGGKSLKGVRKYSSPPVRAISRTGDIPIKRLGRSGDGVVKGSASAGKGYNSFDAFKKEMGKAGDGKAWHHIVEQNQIQKSGFTTQQVHNTDNLIAIESGFKGSVHSQISGYYSSIDASLSSSMRVRDWLVGQSFETQYQFGLDVLRRFGVIK